MTSDQHEKEMKTLKVKSLHEENNGEDTQLCLITHEEEVIC